MISTVVTPTISPALFIPPTGLVITNITVSETNVTLRWQGSGNVQVEQSEGRVSWFEIGATTTSNTVTLPKTLASAFYRLKVVQDAPSGPWVKRFGGTLNESGQSVFVDGSGNIYLVGYFMGTANFGGSDLTSAGGYDLFLAKYSSAGVHQWSRSYGGTGNEQAYAITLDTAGNIFVAGSMYFTCNFGGTNMTSAGDADAFLAKYSPDGDHLWSLRFGANFPDVIKSIAVDSGGDVIVAGFFQGTVDVVGTTIFSWGNGIDPLLAKFNPDGGLVWVKNFYNAGTEYGNAVAVDGSDNIILAGYFNGYINFTGGQTGAGLLNTPGGYIAKFNPLGNHFWSKAYGSPATRFWTMALDSAGNVGIAGDFSQSTDLGGGTITGTSWGLDMFTAKFSGGDGSYQWATPILGFQASVCRPVAMSRNGSDFTLTGYFQGRYSFGSTTITSAPGINDGFTAAFASDTGIAGQAQAFGSSAGASGQSVSKSVATGFFSGTAGDLNSAGGIDVILLSR